MSKVIAIVVLFFSIMIGGTIGYMFLEHKSFWDGLYLTAITVTTVGYGDLVPSTTAGRIFTMVLAFSGVGYVMYTFSRITETIVEGGLRNIFERSKMDKQVSKLKDHYIICGFGRIGKIICETLKENSRTFVVIENVQEELEAAEKLGYTVLGGEAADDDILIRARIDRAKGLIAVVSTDADNLFITLTARVLNPRLFILARSSGVRGAETKLIRAGANKVISPYSIGARRMAHLIVKPTVIDFIDLTMHAGELGLRMEELIVKSGSSIANKTLLESGIRRDHDMIVVAIKRADREMMFNPGPKTEIFPGDILIVLGEHDQIIALEKEIIT